MSVPYVPDPTQAQEDGYVKNPKTWSDPGNQGYSTHDPLRWDAKFGILPDENELMGLINGGVSHAQYRDQDYACDAGLVVGQPVYLSDSYTVALATSASTSTLPVLGFCRYKPTTTTCVVTHFYRLSNLGGMAKKAPVYLQDDGTFGITPGSQSVPIGICVNDTDCLLFSFPVTYSTGSSGWSGYSGVGISGISGVSASGFSGWSGWSSPSGQSGWSGPSGWSGLSGVSGFSAFSGMSGFIPISTVALGYGVKTADESRGIGVAISSDADMVVSLVAGRKYSLEGLLVYNNGTGGQGNVTDAFLSLGFASAATLSDMQVTADIVNTYAQSYCSSNIWQSAAFGTGNTAAFDCSTYGSNTGECYQRISGQLDCTSSGTFAVRWATEGIAASAITMRKGSWIKIQDMAGTAISGFSGIGTSGFSGIPGSFVSSGFSGYTGYSGVSGWSAASPGPSGFSGISGVSGSIPSLAILSTGYKSAATNRGYGTGDTPVTFEQDPDLAVPLQAGILYTVTGSFGFSGYASPGTNYNYVYYELTYSGTTLSAGLLMNGSSYTLGDQNNTYIQQNTLTTITLTGNLVTNAAGTLALQWYPQNLTNSYVDIACVKGSYMQLQAVPAGTNAVTFSGFSGLAGASGISGYSGAFSGSSGQSGVSGFSGQGMAGTSGTSGISGISAFSGFSGYNAPGMLGFSGYSGISGAKGSDAMTSGWSGSSGNSGWSGYSGGTGTSGRSGYSGSIGASGISGLNGNDGASGFSGIDGSDGASGLSGFSGIDGSIGIDGSSGFSGLDGNDGASGFSGIGTVGASGFSGLSGLDGSNGSDGASGFSGLVGTSGFSGLNGSDALTSGFSGIVGQAGSSGQSGWSGVSGASPTAYDCENIQLTGYPIPVGVVGDYRLGYDASLVGVQLTSVDAGGSISLDIWKSSFASFPPTIGNSIVGTPPALSGTDKYQDLVLGGWNRTISQGDTLRIYVNSSSCVTNCTLSLMLQRR